MTPDTLARTFVDLVGERGWPAVTLTDLAAHVGLSLADVLQIGGNENQLLRHFARLITLESLRTADMTPTAPLRERLFDLLMARFEALTPHRPGIRALLRAARTNPGLALDLARSVQRETKLLLDAAGTQSRGVRGAVHLKGLIAIYALTLRIWLDDDSPDLAKTMARLDQELARAERWASRLNKTSAP